MASLEFESLLQGFGVSNGATRAPLVVSLTSLFALRPQFKASVTINVIMTHASGLRRG